jgi:sarcosine oxidase subunit gamma
MTDTRRKSALAHRAPLKTARGEAAIAESPFRAKLVLRGDPTRIATAVAEATGATLPLKCGETSESAQAVIHWLGPDEWWITGKPGSEAALKSALETKLQGIHAQVVDVTDYYTTILLSGTKAREMLMKISTIDLHPRHFTRGMCVTSMFARANPLVRQSKDDGEPGGPEFELTIRISMADYLWCVLAEAGHEWGLPEQEIKAGTVKLHLPHFERH